MSFKTESQKKKIVNINITFKIISSKILLILLLLLLKIKSQNIFYKFK